MGDNMTSLDTGVYGAKVQSWRRSNPRDLLKRLIEENPGADKATIHKTFRDEVRGEDGEEYLDSVIEYWFSNNYHSLVDPAPRRERPAAQKTDRVAEIREKVKTRIRQEAQIILLDMVLPNGKPLRECTGTECSQLGTKVGAWLTKIAGKVKPSEVVGDVLDEAQVRKLYGC